MEEQQNKRFVKKITPKSSHKIICECGQEVYYGHKAEHTRTIKHLNNMNKNKDDGFDKLKKDNKKLIIRVEELERKIKIVFKNQKTFKDMIDDLE
jgi:hypothetical protein